MAIQKTKVVNIDTKNAQTGVRNLKQEIKELRQAMAGMEKGSEEWAEASTKLADALQKQREVAEAAKFANKDFGQVMSNLAGVGAGVVAGINGVTNALSLMGVEMDKDDVGMIKFTQSMMAIVQALATVDTATKAWNGLMTSLNAMLDQKLADTAATAANTSATETNTAAATANAAAKGQQAGATAENATATTAEAAATGTATVATNGLSAAFTKLAAALKLSKAALGIIGIALAAVSAVAIKMVKNFKEQEEAARKAYAESRKWETDAANYAAEAIGQYEYLRQKFINATEAGENMTKWVKEHTDELKKMGVQNQNINNLEDIFINKSDEFVEALTKRYVAQWKLQAQQDQYIANLKDINAFEENFDPNKWTYLEQKITLKIDGQEVTKTYKEWRDAANKAKEENDKLIGKVGELVDDLRDADTELKKFGVDLNNNTNSTRQWNGEIQTLKKSMEQLLDNISVLRNDFANALSEFFGGKADIITTFRNKVNALLLGNNGILGDFNIFTNEFKKFLEENPDPNKISTVENMLDRMVGGLFEDGMQPLEDFGITIDDAFNNWINNIENFHDISTQVGDETINIYTKLDEYITRLRTNSSTINTKNIFNDEEIIRIQKNLTELEGKIRETTDAYNQLSNKKGTMTKEEEEDLKVKQEQLKTLNEEYDNYKRILGMYNLVIEAYQTGHEQQLKLFTSYKALMKRMKDLENEINEGTQWRTADKIAVIRREIEEEEALIESYREQMKEFPPNAEKRIELENKILDSIVANKKREQQITALTYEENLKAYENYVKEQDALYQWSIAQQQIEANKKGFGVEDYNAALQAIQFELDANENKFAELQRMREEDLISEQEYENRRIELLREHNSLEIQMEQEKSNRKLQISKTYYNGISMIMASTTSLLSAVADTYDQNSKEYENIMVARTWMTGIMGSIAAFVSGVESGIPAPYNMILGGVLSAMTIAETALAANQIKSARNGGTQTSGAANINVPTYESMAYQNDVDINDNITDQRVVVVESDIQSVTNHVNVVESEASF